MPSFRPDGKEARNVGLAGEGVSDAQDKRRCRWPERAMVAAAGLRRKVLRRQAFEKVDENCATLVLGGTRIAVLRQREVKPQPACRRAAPHGIVTRGVSRRSIAIGECLRQSPPRLA